MNEKGRITLRIIAGGYLAYLGIDLVKNVITGKPDNAVLFGVVGVLFLVIGAGIFIKALRDYRNYQKAEYEDTKEDETEEIMDIEQSETEEDRLEGGE